MLEGVSEEFINKLFSLKKEYKFKVIFDEVFTGFYKCEKIQNSQFEEIYSELKNEIEYLEKSLPNNLPSGIVHADLFASKIPEPGPSVMRLPVLIENEKSELRVAEGFEIKTLVDGLDSPRWPVVLPNGNILVSGSKTEALPNMPEETIRLLTSMNIFGKSPNTIIEIDMNQKPPEVRNLIQGLNQPFGMLFKNQSLFVANTDSIV